MMRGDQEEMLRLTASAKSLTAKLDAWDALEQITHHASAASNNATPLLNAAVCTPLTRSVRSYLCRCECRREFVQKEGLQAVFETISMPRIRSGRMSEGDVQRAASRLCVQVRPSDRLPSPVFMCLFQVSWFRLESWVVGSERG
eukprot:3513902-Rhodomonas_salina.1